MGEIALTKTMQAGDLGFLYPESLVVDQHFGTGQHPARRWEYAMALRALKTWSPRDATSLLSYDVGGAGSPLRLMLPGLQIIDPKETIPLEMFSGLPASAVFCISTIEHVPALEEFCFHLARVTSPGGLLFLTFDIWGERPEEPDRARWYFLRERIFTVESWKKLAEDFYGHGFRLLGEADWTYHGCDLRGEVGDSYGYSFGSLALVKER